MIAFHYPPFEGGSGIHRTLKFSRYLSEFGWHPIVLSANPMAYWHVSDKRLGEIPAAVPVRRAFAWDVAKHLSIRGRYLKWMAFPDRWGSWWLSGVPAGLALIQKYRPQVIWSTYPIATAHLIGLTLHRLSGIPWIADFRDSMSEDEYPSDPTVRRIYRWIERRTVKSCGRAVFTTPGTLDMYLKRYPEVKMSRWTLIANGYDEQDFILAQRLVRPNDAATGGPITLVHSGVLYPSERNPVAFFLALAQLRREQKIHPAKVKVVFRGCGHEDFYSREIKKNKIEDIVKLEPPVAYHTALAEVLSADGLLIFQASNCNHQIPAKVYEYLRARRPIFAMTDPDGDTAGILKSMGVGTIVPLDSKEQIIGGLCSFLRQLSEGSATIASDKDVSVHSRRSRTLEIAGVLNSLVNDDQ